MTAAAWNSRGAHYRERIYRALVDRMKEPPWKRTTLMLALSAHMPPDLSHRMLRALEHDGMVYGSPVKLSSGRNHVWFVRKPIHEPRGRTHGKDETH